MPDASPNYIAMFARRCFERRLDLALTTVFGKGSDDDVGLVAICAHRRNATIAASVSSGVIADRQTRHVLFIATSARSGTGDDCPSVSENDSLSGQYGQYRLAFAIYRA
jgi:hypothetical protein